MNAMCKGFIHQQVRWLRSVGLAAVSLCSFQSFGADLGVDGVVVSSPVEDEAFRALSSPSGIWWVNRPEVNVRVPVSVADGAFCLVFHNKVPTLHHPKDGFIQREINLNDSAPASVFIESSDPSFVRRMVRLQWVRAVKVESVTGLLIRDGAIEPGAENACGDTGVFETEIPNLRLSGGHQLPEDVILTVYDGYDNPLPVHRNEESFHLDVHLRYTNNPFSVVVRRGREIFHRSSFAVRMENPVFIEPVLPESGPEFLFEEETWIVPEETLRFRGRVPGMIKGSVMVYVDETPETVAVSDHEFSGVTMLQKTVPHQVKVVWQHDGTRHMRYFRVMCDPARFSPIEPLHSDLAITE